MPKAPLHLDEFSEPEIYVTALMHAETSPVDQEIAPVVGEKFGKYLLLGEVAVGGMAEVFLGVHKGLEGFLKVVVIKRVLPHMSKSENFVRMFVDEARIAARLEHPNIVRTYEFGEHGGQYFAVMEYLPGEDLAKTLNRFVISQQRLPLNLAAHIVAQVCSGLHFAHELTDTNGGPLGLVHRDINPSNIVLTYGGEVKIIDFGVAKTNSNASKTLAGTIKGKIAYMSPEQIMSRGVDRRSDVFSAGVMLWECLVGQPLFARDNDAATLYSTINEAIPRPSELRSDVPKRLDDIVTRALARAPADRYQTAEDMHVALDGFLATQPRADPRILANTMEEMFGSTRADAKRSISQTRSLAKNISLVMKLRTEVSTEADEVFDDSHNTDIQAAQPDMISSRPSPRATSVSKGRIFIVALAVVLLGIGCVLAFVILPSANSAVPSVPSAAATALTLESSPSGAAVFVNDEPTGLKTPTTLSALRPGDIAIRLELPGYASAVEIVAVSPGAKVTKQLRLEPVAGRLVLAELPAGSIVVVDGEDHPAGEVISVIAGPHKVEVELNHHSLLHQTIETGAGDQTWVFKGTSLVHKGPSDTP